LRADGMIEVSGTAFRWTVGRGGTFEAAGYDPIETGTWTSSGATRFASSGCSTWRKYNELVISSAVTTFCLGFIGVRKTSIPC
jgi:hypothetical protein